MLELLETRRVFNDFNSFQHIVVLERLETRRVFNGFNTFSFNPFLFCSRPLPLYYDIQGQGDLFRKQHTKQKTNVET